ncbi:unnamed protein product [Sympodiomycopsis kandeliae]
MPKTTRELTYHYIHPVLKIDVTDCIDLGDLPEQSSVSSMSIKDYQVLQAKVLNRKARVRKLDIKGLQEYRSKYAKSTRLLDLEVKHPDTGEDLTYIMQLFKKDEVIPSLQECEKMDTATWKRWAARIHSRKVRIRQAAQENRLEDYVDNLRTRLNVLPLPATASAVVGPIPESLHHRRKRIAALNIPSTSTPRQRASILNKSLAEYKKANASEEYLAADSNYHSKASTLHQKDESNGRKATYQANARRRRIANAEARRASELRSTVRKDNQKAGSSSNLA